MNNQKITIRTAKPRKRRPKKSAFGRLISVASIFMGSVAGVCVAAVLLWTTWGKDPLGLFAQKRAPTPVLAPAKATQVEATVDRQATNPVQKPQGEIQKTEPRSTPDVSAQVDDATNTGIDAEPLVIPDVNSDLLHSDPDESNNSESLATDTESEAVTEGRLAVPSEADQEQALATIKSLFEEQYRVAKTKEQKLNLASEMIKVSEDTREDVAGKYVLLRVARDIATAQSEIDLTESSIATMESSFAVDGTELRIEAWQELLSNTAASDATQKALSKKLVGRVLRHAEQRFNDTDDVAVLKTIEFADAQLNAFIDDKQQQNLGDLSRAAKTRQELLASKNAAALVLDTDPLDPEANEKLGRYYCFYLGQWKRGLLYLSRSENRSLADLATSDLSASEAGNNDATAAAIADGWWEYAEGALLPPSSSYEADSSAIVKEHAAVWYKRSLGTSTGLTRKVAETRIAEVNSIIGMETDAADSVKKNETAKNKLAEQKKPVKGREEKKRTSTKASKNNSLLALLTRYVECLVEGRPVDLDVLGAVQQLGYPETLRIVAVPELNQFFLRGVNKFGEGGGSSNTKLNFDASIIQLREKYSITAPVKIYPTKPVVPLTDLLPEARTRFGVYKGGHGALYRLTKWVLLNGQGTYRICVSKKYTNGGYPEMVFFGFGNSPELWLVVFDGKWGCLGVTKSRDQIRTTVELFDAGVVTTSKFIKAGTYARFCNGARYAISSTGDISHYTRTPDTAPSFVPVWSGAWIR